MFLIVGALPGTLTGGTLTGVEYAAVSGTAASFTDTRGLGYSAADYSATINWRDGSQSTGTVSYDSASLQFKVTGSHTYTMMGNYAVQVFVNDPNGLMAIIDGTANIADAPLIGGTLTPPAAQQGVQIYEKLLYHFSDSDPNAVASEYHATITWAAGQTPTVTSTSPLSFTGRIVADPGGGFDVYGTHTYSTAFSGGVFGVVVTDAGGADLAARAFQTLLTFRRPLRQLFAPAASLPPEPRACNGR